MKKRVILAATAAAASLVAGAATAATNFAVQTYALTADTGNAGFDYAGYNAQLQGGPFGVIAYGDYGSQFGASDGLGTTSGAYSGTVSANPHLTAATDQVTTTRLDHNATATASASADLAAGTLRAAASGQTYVNGYTYDVQGRGLAQFGDGLTFNVAGANAATITDIGFTIHTDGTFGGPGNLSGESILAGLTVSQAGNNTAQYYGGYSMTNLAPPAMNYGQYSGWVSYTFSGDANDYTFQGVYAAQGANPYLTFGEVLYAIGSDGFVDYSHTSQISLQLPDGVTYASDSGVFLTNAGGVPEPASWALMLAGFGALGAVIRHRRTTIGALT